MPEPTPTATRFLGLLDTVTRADLDALDREIDAREDELDGLHAARSLVVARLAKKGQAGIAARRAAGEVPGRGADLPATVTRPLPPPDAPEPVADVAAGEVQPAVPVTAEMVATAEAETAAWAERYRRGNRPATLGDERRARAGRHILRHGPTSASDLCRVSNTPIGSLTSTFDHPWFAKGNGKKGLLDLTPAGRAAVRGDGPDD